MRLLPARNFPPFDTLTLARANWGEPFISFFFAFGNILIQILYWRNSQMYIQLELSYINWQPLILTPLPLPTGVNHLYHSFSHFAISLIIIIPLSQIEISCFEYCHRLFCLPKQDMNLMDRRDNNMMRQIIPSDSMTPSSVYLGNPNAKLGDRVSLFTPGTNTLCMSENLKTSVTH